MIYRQPSFKAYIRNPKPINVGQSSAWKLYNKFAKINGVAQENIHYLRGHIKMKTKSILRSNGRHMIREAFDWETTVQGYEYWKDQNTKWTEFLNTKK